MTLIKPISYEYISNKYILYWLNSPIGTTATAKNTYGKGASQGNLNVKNARNFLVPVPPYNEQMRIVSKNDELFSLSNVLVR